MSHKKIYIILLILLLFYFNGANQKGNAFYPTEKYGPETQQLDLSGTAEFVDLVPRQLYAGESILFPVIVAGWGQESITAVDDNYSTSQDTKLSIQAVEGVLANDSAANKDQLQAELVNGVSHGTLNLNQDGSFDYSPNSGFTGQDDFTYRASLGTNTSNLAKVTLTVEEPPVAEDDSYSTPMNTKLSIETDEGVLANDSAPEKDQLQALLVEDVSHGTLNLSEDGSFEYTPESGFTGQDTFTYRASLGSKTSNLAQVTLTVQELLAAVDDNYSTLKNTKLSIGEAEGVLGNDSAPDKDQLQAVLADDVSHGTLKLNTDGSFEYTPESDFTGKDTFTYRASLGSKTSNPAKVNLTVADSNTAPKIVTGEIDFIKKIIGEVGDESHSVIAADLDGDGDIDAAATDYYPGIVFWFENNGSGDFQKRVLDANLEGAYPSHVGDVDGDGVLDLLACGYLGDTVAWYRNNGSGSFTRFVVDSEADGAHSVVTGDMDRDGDVDLVTSNQDAGTIAWYENDGSNNFTNHIIDNAADTAKRAEIADINGDGEMDVVTAVNQTYEIAWHENDGNESFTKHVIKNWVGGPYYVHPADVDDDGDVDVFSVGQWDHTVAWHENDGTGNFTYHIIDETAFGARTVITDDIDDDGDIDALAASVDDDTVAWYENDGNGNFTWHGIDLAADGAYGLFTIDMDFDGDVDVLSAQRDDDTVAVHTHIRAHTASVDKGGVLLIDSSILQAIDSDDNPSGLTYTITDAPAYGDVHLDGVPLSESGTFTQGDINEGRVTYEHNGGNESPDGFAFNIADGGENGVLPASGTFSININT